MKWQLPNPRVGDTRTRNKFAWFPILVYKDNECYRIWLETYRVTEEYLTNYVSSEGYYRYRAEWKVTKREPFLENMND